MREFWVFGYGSLMWNPGFAVAERRAATLKGAHRSLCVHSWVHRGTREQPGLVLGLDRGGSCRGAAFRVAQADAEEALAYLRARELVTDVYKEVWRPVRFDDGNTIEALAYVVDRAHVQYAGRMPEDEMVRIVASSRGRSGLNIDYLMSTLEHLRAEGIFDARLEAIGRLVSGVGDGLVRQLEG